MGYGNEIMCPKNAPETIKSEGQIQEGHAPRPCLVDVLHMLVHIVQYSTYTVPLQSGNPS